MLDDFGKDMLMLGGTIVGFIATVLTLLEKLLEVKARFTSLTSKKERKSPSPTERPAADSPSMSGFFSSKPLRGVSYLLLHETSVIVAAGLLLNYIGLTLSRHLESILFLDMTGTALVAFLLGPWWGVGWNLRGVFARLHVAQRSGFRFVEFDEERIDRPTGNRWVGNRDGIEVALGAIACQPVHTRCQQLVAGHIVGVAQVGFGHALYQARCTQGFQELLNQGLAIGDI